MEKQQVSKKKIIIAIVVLVFVLITASSYFIFGRSMWMENNNAGLIKTPIAQQNSQSNTAPDNNLQTFKNDKYGFQFQYLYSNNVYDGITTIGLSESVPSMSYAVCLGQNCVSVPYSNGQTLADYLNNMFPSQCRTDNKELAIKNNCEYFMFTQTNTKVGTSIKATELQFRQVNTMRSEIRTYFEHNGNIYNIGYETKSPYFWAGLYDQMRQTFEFNEITPIGETRDYQTPIAATAKDDLLLNKMFPNFTFNNGKADFNADSNGNNIEKLVLQQKVKGSFTGATEKDELFVVMDTPTAHAGGMFHAYLGLFDSNGNLLTAPSVLPKISEPDRWQAVAGKQYDPQKDNAFVSDIGQFAFYDCKGIKYILFASADWPNSECPQGGADLIKFENGKFKSIDAPAIFAASDQLYNNPNNPPGSNGIRPYGLIIEPQAGEIAIKKVEISQSSENFVEECMGKLYKTLNWNTQTCQFE